MTDIPGKGADHAHDKGGGTDVKVPDGLRTRADACASLVGATVPESMREAIRDRGAEAERFHGQRERARKAVMAGTGEAAP